jgi:hypothetical protein
MDDQTKVDLYEIDPKKKYVIQFSDPLPHATLEKIRDDIKAWLSNDNQTFLILNGTQLVKIVKIDDVESAE